MSASIISIDNFISKISKGLAKPNRFIVEFNLPPGIQDFKYGMNTRATTAGIRGSNSQYNKNETINIMCHTCSLPQRSLLTYVHKQLASPYRVPYSQSEYDPVTFSFYADPELNTRRYFDIWQTTVVNTVVNTINYYNEFTTNVTIKIIDDEGHPTYSIILYECYPVSVGMVDLSYSASNQVLSTTVTLAYKQWNDPDTNYTAALPK